MSLFRSVSRSMFLLLVGVSMLLLVAQTMLFEHINAQSVENYERSINRTKQIETDSFAKLISDDFYAFSVQAYAIFSGSVFKQLELSISSKNYTTRYLQNAQHVWSELSLKQFQLGYVRTIEIFLMEDHKKVTPTSITGITDQDVEMLTRITQDNNGMALLGGDMYLWVPRTAGDQRDLSAMRAIAVARITPSNLRIYLEGFSPESSESNLMLSFMPDQDNVFLVSLESNPEPEAVLRATAASPENLKGAGSYDINGRRQLITWSAIDNTRLILYGITPWDAISGELDMYQQRANVYRLSIVLVNFCFVVFLYMAVSHPLNQLRAALSDIRKGDLTVRLGDVWASEYQYVYDQFNRMAEQIQRLVEQEYTMRLLNMRAELAQLQYQINPHFLYNTYFTLRALLEDEEYERASAFADLLGKYLRYITPSVNEGVLSEEIAHAKNYAEIQQLRFSRRIRLEFAEPPSEFLNLSVPRLILQPLIENAFEHGIKQRLSDGLICVTFVPADGNLSIAVEDNGQSISEDRIEELQWLLAQDHGGYSQDCIALSNIHRRLVLFYGGRSGLTFSRSSLGGLRACILILGGGGDGAHADGG